MDSREFMRKRHPEDAKRYDSVVARMVALRDKAHKLGGRSLSQGTPAGIAIYNAYEANTALFGCWDIRTSTGASRAAQIERTEALVSEGESLI